MRRSGISPHVHRSVQRFTTPPSEGQFSAFSQAGLKRDTSLWSGSRAMREDTLNRLTEGVAAFNCGDLDGMLAPTHPDIHFQPLRAVLEGEVYEGHEGFRRWLVDMADDWENFDIQVLEVRPLDPDRVLIEGKLHGRTRGSGVEIEGTGVW